MDAIINNFEKIKIESPIDIIIKQVRTQITNGQLKPGDRLPSERQLSEKFGVGRTLVREAIKKMEAYGILYSIPQSGTFISDIDSSVLVDLISDIYKIYNIDFFSLVETREMLELNSARLCAIRRTDNDLKQIEEAVLKYEEAVLHGVDTVEPDLAIHRAIVSGTQNKILKSLLLSIIPDIITTYHEYKMCSTSLETDRATREHKALYLAIKAGDAIEAEKIMSRHLENVMRYANSLK